MSWQVGDLAVCVDNSPSFFESEAGRLQVGRVYRVEAVGVPKGGPGKTCLAFRDILHSQGGGCAYETWRFRKVVQDKREACEAEFVTLLRKSKRKVSA